jgi:hypothetical protein
LKIQTLHVPSLKVSPATKTNSNPPAPGAPTKPISQSATGQPTLVEQDRRRTQRVLLRVRASIHVAVQGHLATIDAATLSVNPHGAVVVMNQSLPADTKVVLEHSGTRERIACKVARSPRHVAEGYHVPLEFDSPAPGFWKIDFPPSDWRPENL